MYSIIMPETEPLPANTSKRSIVAYVLMGVFPVATTAGCSLLMSLGAGLICLGVTSGIVGYLLGAE
jgi:hypothetical protein